MLLNLLFLICCQPLYLAHKLLDVLDEAGEIVVHQEVQVDALTTRQQESFLIPPFNQITTSNSLT